MSNTGVCLGKELALGGTAISPGPTAHRPLPRLLDPRGLDARSRVLSSSRRPGLASSSPTPTRRARGAQDDLPRSSADHTYRHPVMSRCARHWRASPLPSAYHVIVVSSSPPPRHEQTLQIFANSQTIVASSAPERLLPTSHPRVGLLSTLAAPHTAYCRGPHEHGDFASPGYLHARIRATYSPLAPFVNCNSRNLLRASLSFSFY
jgi:hypothetical protein